MTNACDVFRAGVEFHRHHRLGDQLGRARAHDMDAEHAVAGGIGEDLDEAFDLSQAQRAAIVRE